MQLVPNLICGNRRLMAMACIAVSLVLVNASCKKKEKDVTDRLQNKWSLVQIVDTFYSSTSLAPTITPYEAQTGEYIEFRPDGRMCSYIRKTYDTVHYTFSEQNYKVNVSDHKYNIIILTDNSMILHEPRYSLGTAGYSAYKITLKR